MKYFSDFETEGIPKNTLKLSHPCYNQAVVRYAELDTEASREVCGFDELKYF